MCPDILLLRVLRNTFHCESFPKLASYTLRGEEETARWLQTLRKDPNSQERSHPINSAHHRGEARRRVDRLRSPRTLVYSGTNVSGLSFGTDGGRSQEEESSLWSTGHMETGCVKHFPFTPPLPEPICPVCDCV